jgi:multidrug resistance protein
MNKFPRWYAILCYLAVPISGVGVDIYTPSLPSIAHYLHTTASLSQLSLSVYLLGFGVAQLIIGPFTDRHGRRSTLLISLAIYIALCFAIVYSTTPSELLLGRLLQGIAGAGLSVPVRAMLADISDGPTFKKRVNYMIFAWGMGPILAPWIGSHLQAAFDWKASFYFLAAYCLLAFIAILFTRETHTDRQAHKERSLLANYGIIFKTRFFPPAMVFAGLGYSLMIAFGIVGPFLVEVKFGLSAVVFGRCALLMGVAWVLGSLCNRAMIHASLNLKVYISLVLMLATMAFMGIEAQAHPNSLWILVVPMALLILFGSICFSSTVTYSLSHFQKLAGSANAALFAGVWFVSGIISSVAAHLNIDNVSLFAITLLAIIILATLVFTTVSLLRKQR